MTDIHDDVQRQFKWLIYPGFLSCTPWQWLKHYPRYMQGITYRLDKLLSGSGARDSDSLQTITELNYRWLQNIPEKDQNPAHQATSEFRWMMEELRVSLFAQPLGTSVKVSPQRCEKLLR